MVNLKSLQPPHTTNIPPNDLRTAGSVSHKLIDHHHKNHHHHHNNHYNNHHHHQDFDKKEGSMEVYRTN